MNKCIKQRQDELLSKLPFLKEDFEKRCDERREEIIEYLLTSDETYQNLTQQRADTSQILLDTLNERGMADLFEDYSDAVYPEEIYEGNMIYRAAFLDALEIIMRQNAIIVADF